MRRRSSREGRMDYSDLNHKYAKLSEVREGDILVADGGFTCIKEGARLRVYADPKDGILSVPCAEGGHGLTGQLADDNDTLIGLTKEARG